MSVAIRRWLQPKVVRILASTRFLRLRLFWNGLLGDTDIEFYHSPSDPHSFLLLQAISQLISDQDGDIHLRTLAQRLRMYIVPEPKLSGLLAYSTEEQEQFEWRVFDAKLIAETYPDILSLPQGIVANVDEDVMDKGSQVLLKIFQGNTGITEENLRTGIQVTRSVLLNALADIEELGLEEYGTQARSVLQENLQRIPKKGHYMAGTIYRQGEWFWGVDRLHYLEARLGVKPEMQHFRKAVDLQYISESLDKELPRPSHSIILYWSFRSPYSQLVLKRVFNMAEYYGVDVDIRPVLPMVMRGLKVPFAKQFYIVTDVKREAMMQGWNSYGYMADPLGTPTMRAFVAYFHAKELGKEREFLQSWAINVWSKGVDALYDSGMKRIFKDAGMEFKPEYVDYEKDETWKEIASANRDSMAKHGFWGVPCLVYGDTAVWGQDRVYIIEKAIRRDLGLDSKI